jgi:hypothetical protein
MKKVVLLVGVIFLTSNLFSQVSYRVEYDKPSDKFTYKKIEYWANGEKKETNLKGKLPKLNQGDNVVIEVTNYNPFLYHVVIEDKPMIVQTGKKSNAFGFLSMFTGGLGPISAFMSSFSPNQGSSSSDGTRGSSAKNQSELELYNSETKVVSGLIQDYRDKYSFYQQTLAGLEKEDLKSEVESIVTKLKEVYKNYYDPSDKIALLSSSSKLHFFKAGVSDNKMIENAKSFDYQLTKFKELLADPSNTYTKVGIQEWINKLESAEFSIKKSHMISSEYKTFTIGSSEDDMEQEALVGMNYKIKFYRLKDIKELITSDAPDSESKYVKYYFSDKFWNPEGKIVDTLCENCTPVLRAEGLYIGSAPRNLESIFDNYENKELKNDAYGKWTFYNEKGELSYILIGPETEANGSNNKGAKLEIDEGKLSSMYSVVKSVEIPVKGAIIMNWSTGMYSVGSFKPRVNYFTTTNSTDDTITVQQGTLARSKICIGSQMAFDFTGNKLITPTLNLGAAVDFWDDRDIHFLVGGGLKFKKFPFMSLTAGIAFTQVNVLDKTLQVGQSYPNSSLVTSIIQTKKYVPGYFMGLNINF